MNKNKVWLPLAIGAALAVGMYIGFIINSKTAGSQIYYGSNNPLEQVISLIKSNYVDEVPDSILYTDAIVKVLENLDPHSVYIPPVEMDGVHEEMSGAFEGIGIEFFIVNDTIQVVTPISGGPSEQLGIQAGDKIIKINDSTVAGIKIANKDVIKKLKGPKGTTVKVGIMRRGKSSLINYTIKRDKIPLYSVDTGFLIDDSTGYIRINRFSETTYDEFMDKLKSLKKKGISRLILDLRQNPGGYLNMATKIADEFLDGRKEIVSTEGRAFPKQILESQERGIFEDGKLAILVDEGSASASEIVAGAIQDWDRGIIIGRRTFGKGLVQQEYELANKAAVRLTIAKYFIPSGRCIQKPYDNLENYNEDIHQRFLDGEVFGKSDTTSKSKTEKVFYTKILKRKVYEGGGISPDYQIPYDSTSLNNYALEVLSKGILQEFVYDYYSSNKSTFDSFRTPSDFNRLYYVNDFIYQKLIDYSKEKNVNNEVLINAPAAKKELSNRIKAYFAKQIWGYDGFYPVIVKDDPAIKKALEVFKLKNMFK